MKKEIGKEREKMGREGHDEEIPFTLPEGFLGIPQAPLDSARYCVLPVPYDATVTYKSGARFAPRAIIDASMQVELFDEELKRPLDALRVHTLGALEPNAASPEKMVARVRDAVRAIMRGENRFPLVLGGEHSISVGAVRACLERFPSLTVLYFDAHADLRDEFEGTPYSHACAARRMLEDGARLVEVGVRSLDEEQYEFIKKTSESKLKVFWASELAEQDSASCSSGSLGVLGSFERKINEIVAAVGATGNGSGDLWISFDLDAFDPSEMPSVGTPEPGGLRWRDALRVLRAVASSGARIVGADVVELCPIPGMHSCDFEAARLAAKIVAYNEFLKTKGAGKGD
ncbi:MAG: agmatinase [Candidatus Micrarchaeota archaeon]